MRLNSQLEKAQLENLSSDPANLPDGLVWYNTTSDVAKVSLNGAAKQLSTIDGTETLTNKTIDAEGTGNSLTNIKDANIKAAAAIALSKLAALAPQYALSSDNLGQIACSATTLAELEHLMGVTSPVQTQLNNKQPLDATLTALAAYNTNGLIVQTAADTFAGRTLTAGSNKVSVTNGNGVSGNPTVDVAEANLTLDNIGGTLGIPKGGHGQATAAAGFDALSPLTTKGDIVVRNGTTNTRLAVGSDGTVLTADAAEATGLKWTTPLTNPMTTGGDIIYGGASGAATRLANGSSGQVLTSGGGTNAPSWSSSPTLASPVVSTLLDLTGGQVKFPASQSASANANTLDDYEEGTWTPVVEGTSTAGGSAYNLRYATYTKIGNVVHVSAYLNWTSCTGTGNLQISGLPFASTNSSGNYRASGSIGYLDGLTTTASTIPLLVMSNNVTTMQLYQVPTGGGTATGIAVDASALLMLSMTYHTA